ncbi:P-loop containing nucleoside triphosphate hydrolase protein [Globomyces pollinis-pini]|nr:P-loop containing nucleoside triphosphate hydrolase protein [Globomyces pollinis-pini]
MADTKNQPVQVLVRIRPNSGTSCLSVLSDCQIDVKNPRNANETITYSFNKVFNQQSKQSDVFSQIVPIIDEVIKGRNATIFAYGQTGSGKTHTMNGSDLDNDPGIIPRTIETLLELKAKNKSTTIEASYLEIYNEKIFDLLDTTTRTKPNTLELRETAGKEIVVSGITTVSISTINDFKKYHQTALNKRSTASTNLNEHSSRSHFILQLLIKTTSENRKSRLSSKLHLIDLAGSEDNKRTGNSGARMNESCAINKSLFVLGQVVEGFPIGKLNYYFNNSDSKVTRFLQDSLGGNAIGLMIACCSPTEENYVDTYNTLNFATKSSLIKNVVQVNEIIIKKDDTNSRKDALKEWRSKQKKPSLPPPKRARRSDESRISAVSIDSSYENDDSRLSGEFLHSKQLPKRVKSSNTEQNMSINSMLQLLLPTLAEQVQERICPQLNDINQRLNKVESKAPLKKQNTIGSISSTDQQILKQKLQIVNRKLLKTSDKENTSLEPSSSNPKATSEINHVDQLKESTTKSLLELINNGTLKDLMKMKMIGKKRAEAILESRTLNGQFETLSDLSRAKLSESQISSIFRANMDI